jgi:hypothetical protein
MKDDEIKSRMKQCLPAGTKLRYNDLRSKYIELASCSGSTAENHIAKAGSSGFVKKDGEGMYEYVLFPS